MGVDVLVKFVTVFKQALVAVKLAVGPGLKTKFFVILSVQEPLDTFNSTVCVPAEAKT